MSNFLRKVLKGIAYLLLTLFFISLFLIGFIDNTPFKGTDDYQYSMEQVDGIKFPPSMSGSDSFSVGWAKEGIIPDIQPLPLAGYGQRPRYDRVEDSLYVRTFVFNDGKQQAIFMTIDLMLFPMELADRLRKEVQDFGLAPHQIYFSAIHTHHGLGGWDSSLIGQVSMGRYQEVFFNYLVKQCKSSIQQALKMQSPAKSAYFKVNAPEFVRNRLAGDGAPKDDFVRGVFIEKQTGEKAMLVTYAAHPTLLRRKLLCVSRDYVGSMIQELEQEVAFAAFAAGGIGSHGPVSEKEIKDPFEKKETMGRKLAQQILDNYQQDLVWNDRPQVNTAHIPIRLGASQLRLTTDLRVRSWFFDQVTNGLDASISMLQVGETLFLGMPCDFSGEFMVRNHWDQLSAEHGNHLIITSFNGDYVGYVTPDDYYAKAFHREVRELNWIGPHKGNFFKEIVEKIISNSSVNQH